MNPQTGIKMVELAELVNQRIDLMRDRIDRLEWCVAGLVALVFVQWLVMFLWSVGVGKVGATDYDTWRAMQGKGKS